jgi:ribosomal protein S1
MSETLRRLVVGDRVWRMCGNGKGLMTKRTGTVQKATRKAAQVRWDDGVRRKYPISELTAEEKEQT